MPFILLALLCINAAEAQAQKKNVLFIVGDDIGWSDIGLSDPRIQTPNLNKLMQNGLILNNTYTYSVCTPSRNSILSGVYAEHTGLQHDVILPEQPIGLPLNFKLMPKYFKEQGFKTHMVGKWHIGFCNMNYTPVNRGFDTFFGYFNAQEDYYTHRVSASIVFNNQEGLDYWNQTEKYLKPILNKNQTYSMYTFTERAVQILEAHNKSEPFFMYFASQNAHLPNEVPIEYENKYLFIQDENRRKYLGMVSFMDEAIGNLTKKLDQLGLLSNTLIVFTSDNGGAVYTSGRNYPLRGGKLTAFEGGHRVRAFMNGPGIRSGVYEGMFHSTDWLPTVLNAAIPGFKDVSGIDGINQWPSIANDLPSNRTGFIYNIDPLGQAGCFWRRTNAIREGDWKLIVGCPGIYDNWYPEPTFDRDFALNYHGMTAKYRKQPAKSYKASYGTYLFNIREDPLEKNNLAQSRRDILEQLEKKLDAYRKSVVHPLNPPTLLPDQAANPAKWGDKWSPGWC